MFDQSLFFPKAIFSKPKKAVALQKYICYKLPALVKNKNKETRFNESW